MKMSNMLVSTLREVPAEAEIDSHKLMLRVNSDPVSYTGDSHAPVPFFVTNKGYGIYFDTARYVEVCFGYGKDKKWDNGFYRIL